MKQFGKLLLGGLLAVAVICSLIGCDLSGISVNSDENDPIRSIYASYVTSVTETGKTPVSYETWLASIRGVDGIDGADGKDGETPFIGENGNWWIGETDTGVAAQGEKGEKGDTGAQGKTGKTGAKGEKGDQGEPGEDGVSFLTEEEYLALVAKVAALENQAADPSTGVHNTYNVTVSPAAEAETLVAGKALLSAVSVFCNFERDYSIGWNKYTKSYASAGSGVIYQLDKDSGDAIIITNYHVVFDADANAASGISTDISVFLYGQEMAEYQIPAVYIGGSMQYDIAVLKVTGSNVLKNGISVAATVANSDEICVGQTAIAVGNPEAIGLSATFGHVNVDSEYIEMTASDNSGTVQMRVVRIDTAVNSGNSGGGLFNSEGELIGIVNAKMSDASVDNIGYAIPSNVAKNIADNILYYHGLDESNRQVFRSLLGIEIGASSSAAVYDAETGKIGIEEKVIVAGVNAGGAADGKLQVNDLILSLKLNGEEQVVHRIFQVTDTMLKAHPGDTVVFCVVREGTPTDVTVDITQAMLTASK